MKKRIISLLLVLAMLVSVFPAVAATETVQNPKFSTFYLTLNESIAVNFKAVGLSSSNFGKVEFWKDGALAQEISTLPAADNGAHVFRFTDLSPDELNKKITVKLFVQGSEDPVHTVEKSVKDYCEIILNSSAYDTDIKTVVMDLLNYGEAFQEYKAATAEPPAELEPEDLITYGMSNAHKGYATYKTPTLKDISKVGDQTGYEVQWHSFGLTLKDVVQVYFYLEAESMEGLTMKLTVAGKTWEITEFAHDTENNLFRANFDKLNPVQMKEAIDVQVFDGDTAVSALYTTSIESYAANATDSDVKNVVTQMMMYGGSTEDWLEGQDDEEDTTVAAPRAEIYVASTAEVGKGDGSIENPLANIEEARDMIRNMKQNGNYPEGGVTVYFRGGTYLFADTAYFNAEDSGEEGAPVVYKAYNDEEVNFVGGLAIDAADFTEVTDEAIIARLADPAHTKQFDLKSIGLFDYGQMHVYGMAASYFSSAGISIQTKAAPELFFGDQVMQVAKYPDGDNTWLKVASVKQVGDVIQNWTNAAHASDYIPPEDRPPIDQIKNSIFTVQDSVTERMQRWTQADDIWVYGWWEVDYSDQSMPVKEMFVDEDGKGTIETGIPSGKKITTGRRFYFYNLLEEITEAGEYFIDRDTGILYAYLPAETGTITYGSLDGPVIQISGAENMEITGINFTTGRTNGIEVRGAKDIVLKDLDVSMFASRGIYLYDCQDVLVTGCHVYGTGSGGINVGYNSGSEPYASAIKTMTSLNVVVENCDIHDYSRISKTYSAGVNTAGIGMVVRNCKIYNADHYAISLGGNNTVIENCEIFNVLRSAGDSGAIYNGFAKQEMGQIVRNNFFHDIGSGVGDDVSVIYMDDTKDGVTFESNILVNIGGRGFFINGGWANKAANNIMINVGTEGLLADMGMGGTQRYDILDGGNYKSFLKVYNNPEKYPAHKNYPYWEGKLEVLLDEANGGAYYNAPRYNVIENNILIDVDSVVKVSTNRGGSLWNEAKSREFNDVNNGISVTLDAAGFVDYKNGNFNLTEDSAVKALLGDKAPDFSKMGLYYQVDKPAGFGGEGYAPVTPPTYEGEDSKVISGPLFEEDFSDDSALADWKNGSAISSGIVDGAMQYVVGSNAIDQVVRFKEYAGKVQYELDFMVDFGDCTSIDSGIIIVKGMNAAGAEKSLFNLQAKPNANFGAYDGGGGERSSVAVEENKNYRVRIVCDPVTDTYDFYVDNQPVIIGGKMRSDAGDVVSFTGLSINQKSMATEGAQVTFTYDNIRVTAVGHELYREDFTSPYALDSWTLSGGTRELVDGQLVVTMEPAGAVNHVAPIQEYKGVVTFETDFSVNFNGNNKAADMDGGTILIKGTNATGGTNRSLLNLKVRGETMTFGAYDGNGSYVGQDHETTVKFEENKTYRIKVVCDPYTDSYDFYVDGELVMEGYLREDAVSFTGICINQNRKGGDTAPVFTYDNMLAYTGDGGVIEAPEEDEEETPGGATASVLYSEYFSDPEVLNNWNLTNASGIVTEVNAEGQLQITIGGTGSINHTVNFEDSVTHEGKATYEMDFMLDLNGCLDVDPNIFVVKGNNGSASLLNLKVYIDQETGKITFGAYDGTNGGAEHPSEVECIEGKTYRVTVICDTASDTYDYYVDGVEIFKGAPLRSNANNFSGLQMTIHKKTACTEIPVVCFDNIRVYAGAKEPSSALYLEDFADPSVITDWKSGAPAGDDVVINDAGQLQITKKVTGSINSNVTFIDSVVQEGKVTYELDFKLDLNGCLDVDPNIFVVRGNNGTASLLNLKVYIDQTTGAITFGAYDGTNGGAEHPSEVPCVEGKTYRVTVICDTASDTYDYYVDGVEVFKGAPLRSNANNFSGLQMTVHKKTACEHDAPVIYFDNIAVWAGNVYTGEVGGEEEEPDVPVIPETPEVPEAPKGEYVIGEVFYSNDFATEKDGVLALTGGTKTYTLNPAQAGKVAIQYQTRIVTEDTEFKGKAFFKGSLNKTFANVGFSGGKVDLYGSAIAGVTYENNTWYTVMLVVDSEAQTYNVYLDGVLIKEAQKYHNTDNDLLTLYFAAESGTGTAYFENLIVGTAVVNDEPEQPDTPVIPEGITLGEELPTNYDGTTLELTSGLKTYTLDAAATGKVAIQYKTKLVSDDGTLAAKAFFRGETVTTTFANVGFKDGTINTNGAKITDSTYENDTWYNVMIVADPDAKTYDVYLDGVLIKEDRKYENNAATTDLKTLYFQIESGTGTAYFEEITVHQVTEAATPDTPDEPEAEIKEVLVSDDFSSDVGNWGSKGTIENGVMVLTQPAGVTADVTVDLKNTDFAAEIAKANAANKKLLVEFEMKLIGGYDTGAADIQAGLMLKNSANSNLTEVEAIITGGKIRTCYGYYSDPIEDDTFYKISIITDPATKTIEFYVNGKAVTISGKYINGTNAWDVVRFIVKGNKGTTDLSIAIDNFKISLYDGSAILPDDTTEYPEATVGKKALVLGDSLTSAGQWQTKLVTELGMSVETHALGGLSMSAIINGGTVNGNTLPALTAQQVADKDLIIFYAGYNNRHQTAEAFASTMMTCIDKIESLLTEAGNTDCRIMIVTPHFVGKSQWLYGSSVPLDGDDVPPADSPSATVSLKTLVAAMVAAAEENNIPVYDLFNNSGIGPDTWNTYSNQVADENGYKPGTEDWADQVHLNSTGYALIGTQIAEFVLENWDAESEEPEQPEVPEEPEVPATADIPTGVVLLSEEFATLDSTKWTVPTTGGTTSITDDGMVQIQLPAGVTADNQLKYAGGTIDSAKKTYIKFDVKTEGDASTAFEIGLMLKNGSSTAANIGLKQGKLYAESMDAGVTIEKGKVYTVEVVTDPKAMTFDVYLNGTQVTFDRAYRSGQTSWNNIWFIAKKNDSTAPLSAYIDNVLVAEVVELGTVTGITEGATVTREGTTTTATYADVTLDWSAADATVGRGQDGWWVGIDVTAPEGAENIKYRRKTGDGWTEAMDYVPDSGSTLGLWGLVNEEYIELFKGYGRNMNYTWQFDWNGDGVYEQTVTLSIDPNGVTLNPAETEEPVGTVVYTNTFDDQEGGVLKLVSEGAKDVQKFIDLDPVLTGKVSFEYKIKVEPTAEKFNAKVFFKGNNKTDTIVNVGLSGGKVNLTGKAVADSTYNASEWNHVRIVMDLTNRTYEVFVNGNSVTPGGTSWTKDATDFDRFFLCADKSAAGTAYFDDVIITQYAE